MSKYQERSWPETFRLWQIATLLFPIFSLSALVLAFFPGSDGGITLADRLFFIALMSIPLVLRLAASDLVRAKMNLAAPLGIDETFVEFPVLRFGLIMEKRRLEVRDVEGFVIARVRRRRARRMPVLRLYLVSRKGEVLVRFYLPGGHALATLTETLERLHSAGFLACETLPEVGFEPLRAKIASRVNPVVIVAGFWPSLFVLMVAAFRLASQDLDAVNPLLVLALELAMFPGVFALREWRAATDLRSGP